MSVLAGNYCTIVIIFKQKKMSDWKVDSKLCSRLKNQGHGHHPSSVDVSRSLSLCLRRRRTVGKNCCHHQSGLSGSAGPFTRSFCDRDASTLPRKRSGQAWLHGAPFGTPLSQTNLSVVAINWKKKHGNQFLKWNSDLKTLALVLNS